MAAGYVGAHAPSWSQTDSAQIARCSARDNGLEAWPRTGRLLPWSLALFLAMVYLVPFDQVELPVHLPVNSTPDRFAIPAMAGLWLLAYFAGSSWTRPVLRRTLVMKALILLLTVVAVSVVVNVAGLVDRAELTTAVKQSTLVASYVAFFYLSVTVLRAGELRSFTTLIIALASITATCVLVEFTTGFNFLYWLTDHVIPSTAPVKPPPLIGIDGRKEAVGPASIGLTTATMLSMALPFAIVRYTAAHGRQRLVYGALSALLILGALGTEKKTAVAALVAGMLTMAVYRPRTVLYTVALSAALVVLAIAVVPNLTQTLGHQLTSTNVLSSASSESRTTTLAVEQVDLQKRPFFGRGYGSFDPFKYRYTDDQYLLTAIEAGFVGLAAYLAVLLSVLVTAHKAVSMARRSRAPDVSPVALACVAATVSFIVANALYDALSFPQDPYIFLFIGALAVVAGEGTRGRGRRRTDGDVPRAQMRASALPPAPVR